MKKSFEKALNSSWELRLIGRELDAVVLGRGIIEKGGGVEYLEEGEDRTSSSFKELESLERKVLDATVLAGVK
jgi:hypothetical protein